MACFLIPMSAAIIATAARKKVSEKFHFGWLISMLWGGVMMLAVEHISRREVVPYPPFLTRELFAVFPEMLKVGVPMVLVVVLLWGVMVIVKNTIDRKAGCIGADLR